MAKILHIEASPREDSCSTRLAGAFLESCQEDHPADTVEVLNVFQGDIPPFLAPQAKAKYAVLSGQEPAGEAEKAWKTVIEVIDHFKGFDKYVISSAMWNFGIPYRLKQYVDVIVQPGLTFSYSAETGYMGLVTGKPAMLLLARGGIYEAHDPNDFQETYLRAILKFIGFTDIRSIVLQGTLMKAPAQLAADTEEALAKARRAARDF